MYFPPLTVVPYTKANSVQEISTFFLAATKHLEASLFKALENSLKALITTKKDQNFRSFLFPIYFLANEFLYDLSE